MTSASSFYTYFISSLPMLHSGANPPFSFEKFIEMCKSVLTDGDIEIIKTAKSVEKTVYDESQPILKKWRAFDTSLKNELVKIRASRKHADPSKYLKRDGYAESHIIQTAMNAYKNPSILESEQILDAERWRVLDEFTFGHYFDLDFLIIYAHKLLILEKWQRINLADKPRIMEDVLKET